MSQHFLKQTVERQNRLLQAVKLLIKYILGQYVLAKLFNANVSYNKHLHTVFMVLCDTMKI